MSLYDFFRFRNGKRVTVRYTPSGEEATFIIGKDIDRRYVLARFDNNAGVIHAVIMYNERGEEMTHLIRPEDVEKMS